MVVLCVQILRGVAVAAELHHDIKSKGETQHQLGSGPGTGPPESQPQHTEQHGVMLPDALCGGQNSLGIRNFAQLNGASLIFSLKIFYLLKSNVT